MLPGPQSRCGTRPIDTAPMAALPINVSTTRRERFIVAIPPVDRPRTPHSFHHLRAEASESRSFHGFVREWLSRRKNQRHAQTSRSRRASRHPTRYWTCRTPNGSTRNRCYRNCSAMILRHRGRRQTRRIRAAGIRRCFAAATARVRSAGARNCRAASKYRRCCRPQTCPSAIMRHGRNASPEGRAGRAGRRQAPTVCACRIPETAS